MNNIKVSILGSDGYVCQIPRIKEGMEALGHVLSDESPDLIYSNDPTGYKKALSLKKKYSKAYLILNLLDIPWHKPNIQKQTESLVKNYSLKADIVTTISFKVKKELGKFYNKKIHVIYNPIKDVYFDENIKKNNIFFYVGRASDPVKRFNLVRESLLKIKDGVKKLRVGIKPESRVIARGETKIYNDQNKEIGKITSGTFGPSVECSIAMGYVENTYCSVNSKIFLEVRGKKVPANICNLPFYKKNYLTGEINV